MTDFWNGIAERAGRLAGKWTGYAAFGSLLLYLLGYLSLRGQLDTFGVISGLDILDQKYLFAGCQCLVFLAVSVPSALTLLFFFVAIGCGPYRLVPSVIKDRIRRSIAQWCKHPARLPLLGIVFSVGSIQFLLRKCFIFADLLVSAQLPEDWLSSILLGRNRFLYFMCLIECTSVSAAILFFAVRRTVEKSGVSQFLIGLLAFLVAVEFLMLPINYGVLFTTQQLPRVSEVSGEKFPEGTRIWLVWETKDELTYLLRDRVVKKLERLEIA